MSPEELSVNILNNNSIRAVKCDDPDYPRIDIYLDTLNPEEEHLLIASIEDNVTTGLRVISYNDLSSDESTTTLPVT